MSEVKTGMIATYQSIKHILNFLNYIIWKLNPIQYTDFSTNIDFIGKI